MVVCRRGLPGGAARPLSDDRPAPVWAGRSAIRYACGRGADPLPPVEPVSGDRAPTDGTRWRREPPASDGRHHTPDARYTQRAGWHSIRLAARGARPNADSDGPALA